MSEDQKKQQYAQDGNQPKTGGGVKLPGALPGLGKPSNAPLPGLGKPSNAPLPGLGKPSNAPLPGLGKSSKAPLPGLGAKPAAAPLPGLGAKPAAGPLPGIGAKPGAAIPAGKRPVPVPPFMQQPEEKKPASVDASRDPFGAAPQSQSPAVRRSVRPDAGLIGESLDPSVSYSEKDAGRNRRPLIITGVVVILVGLLFGYLLGSGRAGRVALNIAIRDALIVEWEIKNVASLFNEIQTVVGTALNKANKREYDAAHLAFLEQKVKGNPVKPTLFTERNYKTFDPAAVQWLTDYNNKWDRLDKLIQEHRRRTNADQAALKASGSAFQKLYDTTYGVVFGRNAKEGNKLFGNLVVIGSATKGNKVKVQADSGSYADEREIYNPEPGDDKLSKDPDKYVIELGPESKMGLLGNATQSHFKKYHGRLKEMSDLMQAMAKTQTDLLNKIAEICSQDPVSLGGIDVEEEVQKYKETNSSTGG